MTYGPSPLHVVDFLYPCLEISDQEPILPKQRLFGTLLGVLAGGKVKIKMKNLHCMNYFWLIPCLKTILYSILFPDIMFSGTIPWKHVYTRKIP